MVTGFCSNSCKIGGLEKENAELRANWAELGTWLKAEMAKEDDKPTGGSKYWGHDDVVDKMSELEQSNEQGERR